MRINSYLTFNGNCREAMNFYQKCLGGQLTFQTLGESPHTELLPEAMKDSVVQATLVHDELVIVATDLVAESGLRSGNSVALMLHCNTAEELRACYDKLSYNGQQTHPLSLTIWGALFGDLTDRFGIQWVLQCPAS